MSLILKGETTEFIGGELDHNREGILDDFCELLGLDSRNEGALAIEMIGLRKRVANKKRCPCSCGKRLGKCSLHYKINEFRNVMPRSKFRTHYSFYE